MGGRKDDRSTTWPSLARDHRRGGHELHGPQQGHQGRALSKRAEGSLIKGTPYHAIRVIVGQKSRTRREVCDVTVFRTRHSSAWNAFLNQLVCMCRSIRKAQTSEALFAVV